MLCVSLNIKQPIFVCTFSYARLLYTYGTPGKNQFSSLQGIQIHSMLILWGAKIYVTHGTIKSFLSFLLVDCTIITNNHTMQTVRISTECIRQIQHRGTPLCCFGLVRRVLGDPPWQRHTRDPVTSSPRRESFVITNKPKIMSRVWTTLCYMFLARNVTKIRFYVHTTMHFPRRIWEPRREQSRDTPAARCEGMTLNKTSFAAEYEAEGSHPSSLKSAV